MLRSMSNLNNFFILIEGCGPSVKILPGMVGKILCLPIFIME